MTIALRVVTTRRKKNCEPVALQSPFIALPIRLPQLALRLLLADQLFKFSGSTTAIGETD